MDLLLSLLLIMLALFTLSRLRAWTEVRRRMTVEAAITTLQSTERSLFGPKLEMVNVVIREPETREYADDEEVGDGWTYGDYRRSADLSNSFELPPRMYKEIRPGEYGAKEMEVFRNTDRIVRSLDQRQLLKIAKLLTRTPDDVAKRRFFTEVHSSNLKDELRHLQQSARTLSAHN